MKISYTYSVISVGWKKTEGRPCKRHLLRNNLKSEIGEEAAPTSTKNVK